MIAAACGKSFRIYVTTFISLHIHTHTQLLVKKRLYMAHLISPWELYSPVITHDLFLSALHSYFPYPQNEQFSVRICHRFYSICTLMRRVYSSTAEMEILLISVDPVKSSLRISYACMNYTFTLPFSLIGLLSFFSRPFAPKFPFDNLISELFA